VQRPGCCIDSSDHCIQFLVLVADSRCVAPSTADGRYTFAVRVPCITPACPRRGMALVHSAVPRSASARPEGSFCCQALQARSQSTCRNGIRYTRANKTSRCRHGDAALRTCPKRSFSRLLPAPTTGVWSSDESIRRMANFAMQENLSCLAASLLTDVQSKPLCGPAGHYVVVVNHALPSPSRTPEGEKAAVEKIWYPALSI
jgi:hypothetical protein